MCPIKFNAEVIMSKKLLQVEKIKLQTSPDSWRKVFWADDPIMQHFFENGVEEANPMKRHLIKELDRRLAQLWDKVQHENN